MTHREIYKIKENKYELVNKLKEPHNLADKPNVVNTLNNDNTRTYDSKYTFMIEMIVNQGMCSSTDHLRALEGEKMYTKLPQIMSSCE